MLTVTNRAELRRDAALRPIIECVARALSAQAVELVACRPARSAPQASWLVLRGEAGCGMALSAEEQLRCSTELRRAIVQVRCLAAIADAFGGASAFPLELSAEREPPPEWPRYAAVLGSGECLFACSPDLIEAGLWSGGIWREAVPDRKAELDGKITRRPGVHVRVGLWCALCVPGEGSNWLRQVRVGIDGRGVDGRPLSGWLRCAEGGSMLIEIGEESSKDHMGKAQVRVGLGFIELTLEELLSLRPGSVLELGTIAPLACTLAVGATELVQGVLEPSEGGFLLRITKKADA